MGPSRKKTKDMEDIDEGLSETASVYFTEENEELETQEENERNQDLVLALFDYIDPLNEEKLLKILGNCGKPLVGLANPTVRVRQYSALRQKRADKMNEMYYGSRKGPSAPPRPYTKKAYEAIQAMTDQEAEKELHQTFTHYCNGHRYLKTGIWQCNTNGFLRFLRDHLLLDHVLGIWEADWLFCRAAGAETLEDIPSITFDHHIRWPEFRMALGRAMSIKEGTPDKPARGLKLAPWARRNILPFARAACTPDAAVDALFTRRVLNTLRPAVGQLQRIFAWYALLDEKIDEHLCWWYVQRDGVPLGEFDWTLITINSRLVPYLVKRQQIFHIFEQANRIAGQPREMLFPVFIESLARIGLFVHVNATEEFAKSAMSIGELDSLRRYISVCSEPLAKFLHDMLDEEGHSHSKETQTFEHLPERPPPTFLFDEKFITSRLRQGLYDDELEFLYSSMHNRIAARQRLFASQAWNLERDAIAAPFKPLPPGSRSSGREATVLQASPKPKAFVLTLPNHPAQFEEPTPGTVYSPSMSGYVGPQLMEDTMKNLPEAVEHGEDYDIIDLSLLNKTLPSLRI